MGRVFPIKVSQVTLPRKVPPFSPAFFSAPLFSGDDGQESSSSRNVLLILKDSGLRRVQCKFSHTPPSCRSFLFSPPPSCPRTWSSVTLVKIGTCWSCLVPIGGGGGDVQSYLPSFCLYPLQFEFRSSPPPFHGTTNSP